MYSWFVGLGTFGVSDIWSSFTGRDSIAGKNLSPTDRVLFAVGAVAKGAPKGLKGLSAAKLCASSPGPIHRHHLLPQKFREDFARVGIDIDRLAVAVNAQYHLRYLHGRAGGPME